MDPFVCLANRIYEVILASNICLGNWAYCLFDEGTDEKHILRNKIGVIWLCSLFDALDAQNRFLPEIEAEAVANGWPTLEHCARELKKFGIVVGEVFDLYSREEQIFLQDIRNQFVHSYLAARHREKIKVKYFSNGALVSETIDRFAYDALIAAFDDPCKTVDEVLWSLLSRVLGGVTPLRYWNAAAIFLQSGDEFYKIMCDGNVFNVLCDDESIGMTI